MTRKRSKKSALLMSILSLLTCMTMLIGSTFAWFTDSVTSSGNIIKSGTLKVGMEWADGKTDPANANTSWKDASTGAIFNNDKWEPGYVDAKHIRISNKGTLALKYQLNILANGTVSKLADVIDVYFADGGKTLTGRDMTGLTRVGTLTEVLAGMPANMSGDLDAGKNDTVTIALKMQETANNDYQGLEIGSEFAVQLFATQLTSEEDSFDENYDKFADYDGEISSAASLKAALTKGGTYKVLDNIAIDESMTIPAGVEVNLDMNGKSITGGYQADSTTKHVYAFENRGTLTLKDGTVNARGIANYGKLIVEDGVYNAIDNNGGAAIWNYAGSNVEVNGGTFTAAQASAAPAATVMHVADGATAVVNGGTFKSDADWTYAIISYGDLTINDANVSAEHGAIAAESGKLTINGGTYEITSSGHVIYSPAATITLNGGSFKHSQIGASAEGNVILYASGSAKASVNGGTYDSVEAAFAYSSMIGNISITGGTFSNKATTVYNNATLSEFVADGYAVTDNGNGTLTVSMSQATARDAILAAANSGTPVTLPAGNYTMPGDDIRGKSLTIKGTKDTVIDVSAIDANNQFVTGSTVVFDGVTLKFNESDSSKLYMGFANTASLTYKNCHITGLQILYGNKVTFENCVLDSSANTMGQPHSVWTYGAKNVTFTECAFIYGDRAVNCYKDQDIDGGKQVVNFENCTFTTTNDASEGAVEINSSTFSVGIEVNMDGCTAPANGDMVFISKWDGTDGAMTTINVNGVKIDNATVDHD